MMGELAYKVRRFNESDLDKVIQINRKCLPENYSSTFFLDLYRSYPEGFLVAERDGEVIGYIMCRVEFGFSEFGRFKLTKKIHIVSIAVMEEHRRKGLAKSLLTESIKALDKRYGCSEVYLEVRVSNQPAINLYRKLGFQNIRIIRHYYIDSEDAMVMARKLPLEDLESQA
jgi:ribosomal-protein-alanine N-acetyltransferase